MAQYASLRLPGDYAAQAEGGAAPPVHQIREGAAPNMYGPEQPAVNFSWKTFLIVLVFGGMIAIVVVVGLTYDNTKHNNTASAEDVALLDAKIDLLTEMLNNPESGDDSSSSDSSEEEASASASAAAASSTTLCDVLIIGSGPGGLYAGYRLAPLFGNKLCIVDERTYPGGKVFAVPLPQSTANDALFTPTHA